jgi:hypothetical protein
MPSHTSALVRSLLGCGAGLAALFLGGCATASNSASMAAAPVAAVAKNTGSVSINVTGGSETSSLGASKIGNTEFAEAIKTSITQSGLFAKLASVGQADDYRLDVAIVRLDQPMFGFSMTVTIETNWTLTRTSDKSVAWQKAIISTYTAKAGDAFAGTTRLRLANEGAARTNIQDALTQIGALTLP